MNEKSDRSVDTLVDALTSESVNLSVAQIGGRIKEARKALGLTQDQLAAKAGAKSKSGLQDNEAGKNMPGGQMIGALVRAGINANWLLSGDGPMLLTDLQPSQPVSAGINVEALVQAISAIFQVAPKGESVEMLARKAVGFYQYCEQQGLITKDGQGPGTLNNAA